MRSALERYHPQVGGAGMSATYDFHSRSESKKPRRYAEASFSDGAQLLSYFGGLGRSDSCQVHALFRFRLDVCLLHFASPRFYCRIIRPITGKNQAGVHLDGQIGGGCCA